MAGPVFVSVCSEVQRDAQRCLAEGQESEEEALSEEGE